MSYTLRYQANAPLQPRPHEPTLKTFMTFGEAIEHLDDQPNSDVLEVVWR